MEPERTPRQPAQPPGMAGTKAVSSAEPGSSKPNAVFASAAAGSESQAKPASTTPGSLQMPTLDAATFATGKGGGALRSIGEKFRVSPSTGTLSLSVPIPVTNSRNGFRPSLNLDYDSGSGNGPFGLGWQLGMGSIARKTSHRIPQYGSGDEDVFVHSEGEDLVPVTYGEAGEVRDGYYVREYRLRVEQDRALRVERWTSMADARDVHWRTIAGDNNLTRIYGRDDSSRVFQAAAAGSQGKQIFSWLLCESHDALGNAMHFTYKAENGEGVEGVGPASSFESGRDAGLRSRMRYLKSIKYGNRTPSRRLDTWDIGHGLLTDMKWCFEVVLDYGEHDAAMPTTREIRPWAMRPDPFSACKAGFELRTYRLCRRVLMFHHFEELNRADYLVASTSFEYSEMPSGSFLQSITAHGHIWDNTNNTYVTESTAPLTLEYSQLPDISGVKMQTTKPACLQSLSVSHPNSTARWLDLDGDGAQGLLVQVNGAWFYQRNEMAAHSGTADPESESEPEVDTDLMDGFGPVRRLGAFPSVSDYNSKVSFGDLDGNGKQDLIVVDDQGRDSAYSERLADDPTGWAPLRPFPATLNRRLDEVEVKRIDLTGDGLGDLLMVDNENGEMVWHESLGKEGYSSERRSHAGQRSGLGRPRYLGMNNAGATYLVDMSGDGLEDIAEFSNGRISYWPNLGYGRFGGEVVMSNAPVMGSVDVFDFGRLRLLDVDGSGTADILYLLPHGGATVYFNHCGNSWSNGVAVPQFPRLEQLSSVFSLDLLGKGTSCLCWTGPDASTRGEPVIHYLDLAEAGKPHLLTSFRNGTGQQTRISYQTSTKFFLRDERAGRPWTTRLPFPVHVVSKVTLRDSFSQSSRVTKYAYHDGFFDGHEKVFRGFSMVETWERDEFLLAAGGAARSKRPVYHQKMWFHTGSPDLPLDLLGTFSHPMVRTALPAATGWNARYQAARALKGKELRVEKYGLDGSAKASVPYSTQDTTYDVETILQAQGKQRPGVFRVTKKEQLFCTYEREDGDPRSEHELILARNAYGDITKMATLYYGRKTAGAGDARCREWQQENRLVYSEKRYTIPVETVNDFYTPRLASTKTSHILGLPLAGIINIEDARTDPVSLLGLDVPEEPPNALPRPKGARRLQGKETQILYRRADMTGPLAPGQIEPGPVIMVDQEFELSLTPHETDAAYGASAEWLLGNSLAELMKQGGYQQLSGWDEGARAFTGYDGHWWVPSSRALFPQSRIAQADSELARARLSFFTPGASVDAFGNQSTVEMDPYRMLPVKVTDAVGNVTVAANDYRTMMPAMVTDPNGNRTGVRYGPLGDRLAVARMGKDGEQLGDDLELHASLALPADILPSFIENPTEIQARDLLMKLGKRWLHSRQPMEVRGRLLPPFRVELSRTKHAYSQEPSRLDPDAILMSVTYLSSGSSTIQTSTISSWGDNRGGGNNGQTESQWVNTGCVLRDSAGQIVKEHQPFFAREPLYQSHLEIDAPATFHFVDVLGRQVGALLPDLTWSKSAHTAWSETAWAAGDTIAIADPRADSEVGVYFRTLPPTVFPRGWQETNLNGDARSRLAAERSTGNANPVTSHLDGIGRVVSRVEGDGSGGNRTRTTAFEYNVYGDMVLEVDSLERIVQKSQYDRMKHPISVLNMDAGRHVTVVACDGHPVCSHDSRFIARRMVYDALRRHVETRVQDAPGQPEYALCVTTWGEGQVDAEKRNLRGRVASVFDQCGIRNILTYDFKGNALRKTTQLASDYHGPVDCSGEVELLPKLYESTAAYNALDQAYLTRDALGRETVRAYDLLGRVTGVKSRRLQETSTPDWTPHVNNTTYTADGLPSIIERGNGCITRFEYDTATRSIVTKTTRRSDDGALLEDLSHTYDCYRRLVRVTDGAQETVFFRNNRVEPTKDYFYDQWGRLTKATGREMVSGSGPGSLSFHASSPANPLARMGLSHSGRQMVSYTETYTYDDSNNILQLRHEVSDAATAGWTRRYVYQQPSRTDATKMGNRLSKTDIAGINDEYGYEAEGQDNAGLSGCMTSMPGFSRLRWDANKQLKAAVRPGAAPETTFFVYNADGVRVRKVTERTAPGGAPGQGIKLKETLFLDAAEIQLKYDGDGTSVRSMTTTSLITNAAQSDDSPLVLIENTNDPGKPETRGLLRYSLSPSLEVDDHARVVSYEEYSPYGVSTLVACRADIEAPSRYRFASYRRDSETGLYHCGARYYIPVLGRWLSPDPIGTADGLNVYCYCANDPVNRVDPTGTTGKFLKRFQDDHPRLRYYIGNSLKMAGVAVFAGFANAVVGPAAEKLDDKLNIQNEAVATFTASSLIYMATQLGAWGVYKAGKWLWNKCTGAQDPPTLTDVARRTSALEAWKVQLENKTLTDLKKGFEEQLTQQKADFEALLVRQGESIAQLTQQGNESTALLDSLRKGFNEINERLDRPETGFNARLKGLESDSTHFRTRLMKLEGRRRTF
ncbi:SpvB-domain-containing protein [Madurella fahalii]|uniref:SpvB-domain-containing protein n=1 Tax=Madurella fahalii TaxID=1157608 RepID=A0ABQ0G3K9_9PEZI